MKRYAEVQRDIGKDEKNKGEMRKNRGEMGKWGRDGER